jgi:hypothetical protein
MFLNSKQEKAVQFAVTILESRGLEILHPEIKTNHSKISISEIKWKAVKDVTHREISAHILLTKWDKKFKLIVWLPKDPQDGMTSIDSYVILNPSKTHLILPYGQGQLSLHKIDPEIFMSLQEMRDYLGY